MYMKKRKEWITRDKVREKEKKINLIEEIFKTIHHLLPNFRYDLLNVKDNRNQSYISYKPDVILFTRILSSICSIESMNSMSKKFNQENVIKNVNSFTKSNYTDLPHYTTINNFLKTVEPCELEKIRTKMIKRLLKNKCFDRYKFLNKFWKVAIDATGIYTFDSRHCEHCLTKTYNKGTDEEKTIYFHYVLEAKLIVGNMSLSLGSEFIENPSGEFDKQDCELKAFYRLAKKIKKDFPKLSICTIFDSLYANAKVLKIVTENKWGILIRFQEGSIKTLAEDFNGLKKIIPKEELKNEDTCIFANEISYREFSLNMAEYTTKDTKYPFCIYFILTLYSR